MDITNLKKDIERCYSALKIMPDKSVVALKKLKICFPKRYEKSGLAEITETVRTILAVGIIVDNYYSFIGALGEVVMRPGDIIEENINNDRYYVLYFEPGDIVIESLAIPIDNSIGYYYYLEFDKYARVPWYVSKRKEIVSMYDEAKYYTKKSMGNSNNAFRVLMALTGRDPENLDIPFRYSEKFFDLSIEPKVIGINNPSYLLTGVFNKFNSGYLRDNILSGIRNPDSKVTDFEKIYRGIPNE